MNNVAKILDIGDLQSINDTILYQGPEVYYEEEK